MIEKFDENKHLSELQKVQTEILREFHKFCEENNLHYVVYAGTLIGTVRHGGPIPWDDDVDVIMPIDDYYRFLELAQKSFPQEYFIQHHSTDPNYVHQFIRVRKNNTLSVQKAFKEFDIHHGIFIDVFPLNQLPKGILSKKIYLRILSILKRVSYVYYPKSYHQNKSRLKKAYGHMIRLIPKSFWDNFTDKYRERYNSKNSSSETVYSHCTLNFDETVYTHNYFKENEIYNRKIKKYDGIDVYIPKNYDEILTRYYGEYMSYPTKELRKPHHGIIYYSSVYNGKEYRVNPGGKNE